MIKNRDNQKKKKYMKPKFTIKFLFTNLYKMRDLNKNIEETLLLAADKYLDDY